MICCFEKKSKGEAFFMASMQEYLLWRGDIRFSQLPPNPADMLIFSTLSYIDLGGIVSSDLRLSAPLRTVAKTFLALSDARQRCRVEEDLALLEAVAKTDRFGDVRLTFYRDIFVPEEDTQFAAVTFLLDDGTACLTFRGTDSSLVGWKEDFNMTFQDSIPAQRLAKEYTEEFAAVNEMPLRMIGHSKGGNLAVYAASKGSEAVRQRILEVHNQDGPGFPEAMMTDPGYLEMLPKIRTFVPQSSVFGMLLEHRESYVVIKSKQLGIMQHEPHSWELMGPGFITMEERTADSHFLDRTFRDWLENMTLEERNEFFDTVFDLLMTENANRPRDLLKPQNVLAYLKTWHMDESTRRTISTVMGNLLQTARQNVEEMQTNGE